MSTTIMPASEGFQKHSSTELSDFIIYAECPYCQHKNTIYSATPGATLCSHYKDHALVKPTIAFKKGD